MKVLITGAAGFVGSNLTKRILSENHEVVGIDDFSYGLKRNIQEFKDHKNFHFIEADICNYDFDKMEHHFDIIVHLASQKIPRYTNALITLEKNNSMMKKIIELWKKQQCKLVFSSTSDVYGKNKNIPFDEECDLVLGPTNVKRWAYATSKIYSEQLIIANHDEYKLPYTIVRFFGSYGKNQNLTWWGGPQSVFIDKAMKRETLEVHGDGQQTRSFTYIEDTIEGLMKCIFHENALNNVFNIASDKSEEITILELAKLVWNLVNPEDDTPNIKLIPYSTFGKYEDVRRRVPNINKIKNLLGFEPKWDLKSGLEKTIIWQKEVSTVTA